MPRKNTISPKIVTGVYFNNAYAEEAVKRLLSAGFQRENLMVIGGDTEDMRQISYPLLSGRPDMFLIRASIAGAVIGAISAWIAVMYIPGFEFFLSVVPLLAMVAGAAAGSYVGFLTGTIMHFDKPSYDAQVQTTEQLTGSVLISTRVSSVHDRYKAEAIMEEAGAVEVLVEQPHGEEFTALYHTHNPMEQPEVAVEPPYVSEPIVRKEPMVRNEPIGRNERVFKNEGGTMIERNRNKESVRNDESYRLNPDLE